MLGSKTMRSRPLVLSLMLMVATAVAGLAARFALLGLPPIVVKYGSSTLWALKSPSQPKSRMACLASELICG
jgi:hypothetical protein